MAWLSWVYIFQRSFVFSIRKPRQPVWFPGALWITFQEQQEGWTLERLALSAPSLPVLCTHRLIGGEGGRGLSSATPWAAIEQQRLQFAAFAKVGQRFHWNSYFRGCNLDVILLQAKTCESQMRSCFYKDAATTAGFCLFVLFSSKKTSCLLSWASKTNGQFAKALHFQSSPRKAGPHCGYHCSSMRGYDVTLED